MTVHVDALSADIPGKVEAITPATAADEPVLRNLTQLYAYDFAEAKAPYFRNVPRPASFSLA